MNPTADARLAPPLLAEEIPRQGALLRQVLSTRRELVAETAARCLKAGVRDWVFTGCGDSLFAGMCAEYWFAEAGLPARAEHALAFSRYLYRAVGPGTAVVAVSFSGNTARVVEAAVAAKARGATVVAVTADPESRLVEIADHWLPNDALEERSNCRTLSFQACCALVRLLAGEVGVVPGRVPDVALTEAVDALAAACDEPLREVVAALPATLVPTVIGGGYGYPLAHYGAAKLYEAATIAAHVSELEQFVHCEIFPVGPSSGVVLVAPRGASSTRAAEVVDGLASLGAVTIGITDDPALDGRCTHLVRLPEGFGEGAAPFLAAVPLQLLALHWAQRRGENPDLVANKAVNRPLIERSAVWASADYARLDRDGATGAA